MGTSETTRGDLVQRLIENLFTVIKQIHRDMAVQEMSLSLPQARLLFTIARHKDAGITVKELSEKAGVTPGAITQFVNTLVDKGLVQREIVQDDRRMVRLTITDSARSQTNQMRKQFLACATRTFSVLSNEELEELAALMVKATSGPDSGDTG
jgi:DNA-binding MarR family transcriptional regulator